jgi:replicative DNA helicase
MNPISTINSNNQQRLRAVLTQFEHSVSDHHAEGTFIACLLASPNEVPTAARLVPSDYFSGNDNRTIYGLILSASLESQQAGYTFGHEQIRARLTTPQQLDCFAAYAAMSQQINAGKEINGAFDRMRKAYIRSQAFRRMGAAQERILNQEADAGQAVAFAATELTNLLAASVPDGGMQPLASGPLNLDNVQEKSISIPFLPRLMELTRGLRAGRLHTIVSRTGGGKSALMLAMAVDVAVNQNIPVLYLDSEMDREEVQWRALAMLVGKPEQALRRCRDNAELQQQVEDAHRRLAASPLRYVQTGGKPLDYALSMMDLFARAEVARQPQGLGLILHDYLKPAGGDSKTPEFVVLGEMAEQLKQTANRLKLPIVTACQANRSAIGLSHSDYGNAGDATITGSDRIAHNSDVIMTLRNLHHEEQEIVRKQFPLTQEPDAEPLNNLPFNAVLHLHKCRGGANCPFGLPIFHHRGTYRFTEKAVGKEMNFLRDSAFLRRRRKAG